MLLVCERGSLDRGAPFACTKIKPDTLNAFVIQYVCHIFATVGILLNGLVMATRGQTLNSIYI